MKKIVILLLLLCTAAQAREVQTEELSDPPRVRMLIWGQAVMELVAPRPGEVEKVVGLLQSSEGPVVAKGAELYVGGQLLHTATPDQAARWGTDPAGLAQAFATRLRTAFAGPPPLNAQPASLVVPLGEKRRTRLSATGPVSAPAFVSVEVAGNDLLVEGLAPGSGELTVDTNMGLLTIPLKVRPWAAILPSQLELELTGGLPLQDALHRAMLPYLHADADVSFTGSPEKGELEITADGPGLLKRGGKVQVTYSRQQRVLKPASKLVLSNRPEKIFGSGSLFKRTLIDGPWRVLYHHKNGDGEPWRVLEVVLRNPTSQPQRVHWVVGSVGPSPDEIHVGHVATLRYAERAINGSGQWLTIAPGSTRCVDRLGLKPGQTASGLAYLESPGVLELEVRTREPQQLAPDQEVPEVRAARTARGVFDGHLDQSYSHTLGSRYTYIDLGGEPYLTDPVTGEASPGNFGTIYRIRLVLLNPTDFEKEAWVEFVPGGGPARGVVYVDQTLVDVAMARSKGRIPIARWKLAPQERREVLLETVPQSGSNYPVRLVVQSQFEGKDEMPQQAELKWEPVLP